MKKPCSDKFTAAILVRQFPNIVQTYILNHIIGLKNSGILTTIVAERDPGQAEVHPAVHEYRLREECIYINTEVRNLPSQFMRIPFGKLRYWKAVVRILRSDLLFRHGLSYTIKALIRASIIAQGNYDLMHSHSLFNSYDYLFMKKVFGIPLATTFHGLVPKNVEMLAQDKIRTVVDTGDVFFVNTTFARDQLSGFHCDENKIHIIPQATSTEHFPFRERRINLAEETIILSVGRLSAEKGFHIAIDAIALLKESYPNLAYHIVGNGIERDNLIDMLERLELQDKVRIFGSVSTESLLEHYASAHIFILPSIDFRDGSHTARRRQQNRWNTGSDKG